MSVGTLNARSLRPLIIAVLVLALGAWPSGAYAAASTPTVASAQVTVVSGPVLNSVLRKLHHREVPAAVARVAFYRDGSIAASTASGQAVAVPALFGLPDVNKIVKAAKAVIARYGGTLAKVTQKLGENCASALFGLVVSPSVFGAVQVVAYCGEAILFPK